jgi:hypothetical protein
MPKQIDIKPDGTPVVSGIVSAPFTLASSDDAGKVKIDPATGVMSVNPDLYSVSAVLTNEKWINGAWIYRVSGIYTRSAGGFAGDTFIFFNIDTTQNTPIKIEGLYTPDGFGNDFIPIGTEFADNGTVYVKWNNVGDGDIKVLFPYANTYHMRVIVNVMYINGVIY